MLNQTQKDQFWQDGVITIEKIFTAIEVAELRFAVEALSNELKEEKSDEQIVHLQEITTKNPIFRSLAKSTKLTSLVTPLLGPNLQLHHSKLATKPPYENKGGVCWHQDFPFFPHTNSSLVAVMVMLDDSTPDNGCMYVVPGSHKLGALDHDIDGWFTRCCQEVLPEEIRPYADTDLMPVTPSAGGISIHHCLTLHCSPPNQSRNPRRGLVFEYRAADAVQLSGGSYNEIPADCGWQVCGVDNGHVRCEENTLKLPKKFFGKLGNDVSTSERTVKSMQHRSDIGAKTKEWNSQEAHEIISEKVVKASAFALEEGYIASLIDLLPRR